MDFFQEGIIIYEEVLDGTRKRFPINFFSSRTLSKKIVRYVLQKEYGDKLNKEIICNLTVDFFINARLKTVLKYNNPFSMFMIEAFPEMNMEIFEFKKVPNGYWDNKENRIYYLNWLFKKLNIDLNNKDSIRTVTADVIVANHGSKAIRKAGGVFELLNEVLNDRFKVWEVMDISVWKDDIIVEAVRWLFEEKLGYEKDEIITWKKGDISSKCKKEDISKNNLEGLWKNVFDHSILKMIRYVYY